MLRFGLDKAVGSLEINTISVRNIAVTILMTGLFFSSYELARAACAYGLICE